jgi:carboxypeptidase C (cathepsin A)
MLYFESPAGVGFSYPNSRSGLTTNDSETANDNYEALTKFFNAYSEYISNELFLTGESYAGIYVPTLAHLVLKRNNNLNLKGIMGMFLESNF